MSSRIFLFLSLCLIRLVTVPLGTSDFAIWLNDGLSFLEQGLISRSDQFSIHSNLTFIYPARLSNIIFALLYKAFDFKGALIFLRVYVFFTFIYIFYICTNKFKKDDLLSLILSTLACIGSSFILDRAQVLVMPLALFVFSQLGKKSYSYKNYFILFCVFVLWGNLHSSILILLLPIGWKILLALVTKSGLVNGVLLFAMLLLSIGINPEFISSYKYYLHTIELSKERGFIEWNTVFQFNYPWFSGLYIFSLLTFLFLQRKSFLSLLKQPLFPLIFIGLFGVRNIVWFYLSISSFKFRSVSFLNNLFKKRSINISLAIAVLVVCSFEYKGLKNSGFDDSFPVGGINKLKELPSGRVFNKLSQGGVISLLTPHRVYIDSRNIIYSNDTLRDYHHLLNCYSQCSDLLNKYHLNIVMLPKNDYKLIEYLGAQSNWSLYYDDEKSIIYQKIN